MSYQVLARKWRPNNFIEMVGQDHIIRALVNALDHQRLHHAYLFTGTRGVGKTTIARIIAKCLNCETGITSQPCERCNACEEITAGRFIDLIEVDAASRTKVEDTRELLDNVPYAPTRGRFKIYLIDEVHMLSTHSFNALLKTLEEPPAHVKFLLATTDPKKLPITVLSRCLQFHLKCLSREQIVAKLQEIVVKENIASELVGLQCIAQAAAGSMRDALSLLDQAINHGNGQIETLAVKAMLGTIDNAYLYRILEALAQKQANELIQITQDLAEQASDFGNVLEELLSLLHQIAVQQLVPNAPHEGLDANKIQTFAKQFSAQDIQLYYQIALIGRRDLTLAPTPKSGLEMILLRMLAFCPTAAEETTQSVAIPSSLQPMEEWPQLISKINLRGMSAMIASHCTLEKRTDDEIILTIDPTHAQLLNQKHEERLNQALSDYFQRPIKLTIQTGTVNMRTPAALAEKKQIENQQQAEQILAQDENIKKMVDTFNAKIVPHSIAKIDD